MRGFLNLFIVILMSVFPVSAFAQNFPNQKYEVWPAKDFRFHTGEVAPRLNIGYNTIGNPSGEVIVILHGTTGTGAGMLSSAFGGELFGPGQPLDAAKYFIVLPDSIGTGKSSKPSDGLKAQFPKYNYDDMVAAQYRLLTEKLNLKHLRMVLGNSMGGMQTWLWGVKYPNFMDILVPMASMPSEMSSRNWMMRRLIIDSIRNDPEWMGGNYVKQPRSLQFASVLYAIGTNGGTRLSLLGQTRDCFVKLFWCVRFPPVRQHFLVRGFLLGEGAVGVVQVVHKITRIGAVFNAVPNELV